MPLSPYRPSVREISFGDDDGEIATLNNNASSLAPNRAMGPKTHDVIFSGGIHIRIRNGLSREHVLVDEFDVTIVLRSLQTPSAADVSSQRYFPRAEFFVQGVSDPAQLQSQCIASYGLSQMTNMSIANSVRSLILEFLPSSTAAALRSNDRRADDDDLSSGLTFLVQLIFPEAASRNRVHQAITAAHKLAKETQALASAAGSSGGSDAPTLSDALATVRRLQQKTHKLLDEVRSEAVADMDLADDHGPGGKLRNWAMLMLDRRKRLEDAHDALSEIQNRRALRKHVLQLAETAPIEPAAVAVAPQPQQVVFQRDDELPISPHTSTGKKKTRGFCPHCSKRMPDPSHEDRCAHRPVRCRVCKELMMAAEFRHHRKYDCIATSGAEEVSGSAAPLSPTMSMRSTASISSADEQEGELKEVRRSSRYLLGRRNSSMGGSGGFGSAGSLRRDDSMAAVARRDSTASTARPSDLQRKASTDAFVVDDETPMRPSSSSSALSMTRRASTLDITQSHCPHCNRRAPASHNARCAHRMVTCADCGAVMKAKDAAEHAASYHQEGPSRRFKFP